MDSLTLRIILLALGVFFIVGIYLWDKRNHVDARLFNRRKSRKKRHASRDRQKGQAGFGNDTAVDGLPSMQITQEAQEPVVEEPLSAVSFTANAADTAEVEDGLPSFSARSAFDEFMSGAELPTRILQINLLCKDARISGQMILDMVAELDLQHGEYSIFHRMDPKSGKSIFSVANAVEPGSFDLQNMDDVSTPGLALFSQLPAPVDGIQVYNAMLEVAQRMAFIVGGELQDASHSTLTKQRIEHEKEQIEAYRVKLNKAMQDRA